MKETLKVVFIIPVALTGVMLIPIGLFLCLPDFIYSIKDSLGKS